jgi:N-methylhydantoinase B/oxoprolinase/acetone carboxylase alpha subunit
VVVERGAHIPDSGGAGKYRGGLGIESVVRARTNMVVNTQTDRSHCPPWGLGGGLDATGNHIHVRYSGLWKTDQRNAKMLVTALKPGDAFRLRSGGGGGYGSPLDRDLAAVVPAALGRGRGLWLAARPRPRRCPQRRAPGLRELGGGARALRRGDRSRDPGDR